MEEHGADLFGVGVAGAADFLAEILEGFAESGAPSQRARPNRYEACSGKLRP